MSTAPSQASTPNKESDKPKTSSTCGNTEGGCCKGCQPCCCKCAKCAKCVFPLIIFVASLILLYLKKIDKKVAYGICGGAVVLGILSHFFCGPKKEKKD